MKLKLLLLTSTLAANTSFAGSRGYNIVLINIGDQSFYHSEEYKNFIEMNIDLNKKCWDSTAAGEEKISLIAKKKIPPGITVKLARQAINGDNSSIESIRKLMIGYKDENAYRGFDGTLIIDPNPEKIKIMGIRINSKNPSKMIKSNWKILPARKKIQQLDLLFCKASSPLNIGFGY